MGPWADERHTSGQSTRKASLRAGGGLKIYKS